MITTPERVVYTCGKNNGKPVTPSTSMSALARGCFNAFSATVARRWAQGSAPLRQLSTNSTPVDDPLLWGKLLDTTNATVSRTRLTAQSPDDAWLAQHKRSITSLTPPNNTYTGMPLTHSLPTPAQRSLSQVEALRSRKTSRVLPLQAHTSLLRPGFGEIKLGRITRPICGTRKKALNAGDWRAKGGEGGLPTTYVLHHNKRSSRYLTSPIPDHRSGKRSSSSKRSEDEAPKHAYIRMVSYHMHPYHNFFTIR